MSARASVSVLLATSNRSASLLQAVRSILAIDDDFELFVVDQSDEDAFAEWPADMQGDRRLVHHRMERRGLSAARNVGMRLCRGDIVVMTDDDCEVPRDWLRQIERAFARSRRIGMLFGNVRPAPFDGSKGTVPAYVRKEPFLGRRARDKNHIEGMGACMALRRELWDSVGGFDELLGAGGRFPAAEEGDLVLRALRKGYHVYETPEVELTHHGFRTWEEGARLVRSYWYGTGAMFAKNLKLAPLSTSRLLAGLAWRWFFGQSHVAASLGRVANRRSKLLAFGKGVLAGLRVKVDRVSGCFETAYSEAPGDPLL